jgi:RNA polymerase sigma-54 factor
MRLDTTMQQRMDQRQILAPRMIQSMEILQLPIMALQERIQQELQENPVLELKETADEGAPEDGDEAPAPAADDDRDPGAAELVIDDSGTGELDFDRLEALSKDWDDHFNEEHRPSRNSLDDESDKKHDAMQNMASRPQSLQDYLAEQLAFFDTTPEQDRLLHQLLNYLDEKGFLTTPLEEIARAVEGGPVPVERVEEALRIIQKMDPPGVGARDIKECLLLQLTPEMPYRDVLRVLIQNHLEDITHNRLPAIQRRTGFDLAVIKQAIEALKHLNTRPGEAFTQGNIPYVVPDIVVERNDAGGYDVRLLDDWLPNIYISRRCIELYREKSTDPKTREYLKRKIQAAQWLQESIEQRRSTLEKVTRAIIQHQRDFLEKGPDHIQPLKMQQIADDVGVHVTTVSRAVDDKWVQTPRGIFSLKRFFGGGTATDSGEEVAWETIKQKLLEIIAAEDKANPLSDEDLVAKLNEAGYPIRRRTVTKYRKMAHIPSSRQRKDWTAVSAAPPPPAAAEPEPPPAAEQPVQSDAAPAPPAP